MFFVLHLTHAMYANTSTVSIPSSDAARFMLCLLSPPGYLDRDKPPPMRPRDLGMRAPSNMSEMLDADTAFVSKCPHLTATTL